MKKLIRETAEEILQEYTNCYSEADEDCLVKMLEKLASNMAREIFAEIDAELCNEMEKADDETIVFNYDGIVDRVLDKLKKKYESEGADDGLE